MESFWAMFKVELSNDNVYPSRIAAKQAIFQYIEGLYNQHRRHSALSYLSPTEFEWCHTSGA
jgi:transposase InsO family protein